MVANFYSATLSKPVPIAVNVSVQCSLCGIPGPGHESGPGGIRYTGIIGTAFVVAVLVLIFTVVMIKK